MELGAGHEPILELFFHYPAPDFGTGTRSAEGAKPIGTSSDTP